MLISEIPAVGLDSALQGVTAISFGALVWYLITKQIPKQQERADALLDARQALADKHAAERDNKFLAALAEERELRREQASQFLESLRALQTKVDVLSSHR